MRRSSSDDRGSVSIEMVLLAPAFLALLMVLVVGGRLAIAHQAIQSAASEAARVASQERGADAEDQGRAAATSFLDEAGLQCESLDLTLDTEGKDTDPGMSGQFVGATVTCDVALGDLAIPGMGGTRALSADASSPIDTYRER